MNDELITGVVSADDDTILFSTPKESFDFCIMTNRIFSFSNNNKIVSVSTEDGFIRGKTHDNRSIAIAYNRPSLDFFGTMRLRTDSYIVSTSSWDDEFEPEGLTSFDAITFYGGTLNTVFSPNGMDIDREDGRNVVKYKDDSLYFTLQTGDSTITITVKSQIRESWSIYGNAISNIGVEMIMEFDKSQPLSAVYEHYNNVRDVLSFMTFRNNVGFDSICIQKKNENPHFLYDIATVFVKSEEALAKKNYMKNICFVDIENSFSKLLELFYEIKEKKNSLSLGFLPSNDGDVYRIDNSKIRAICSAIESELSFDKDVNINENIELQALVAQVRETIDQYREQHTALSQETYGLIDSSVGHWSVTLAERIWALFQKHIVKMCILNDSPMNIDNAAIKAFVKYRNDITHGRHRVMTEEIARTAICLRGLIYCCVLSRVGVSDEKIQDLCRRGAILT